MRHFWLLFVSFVLVGATPANRLRDFTIPYLNPGRCAREASAAGFRTCRRGEFTLEVNLALRFDIPKIWAFNNRQYAGGATWIRGWHSLKLGGDLLRAQYFSRNYGDTRGRATFLSRFTGDPLGDFVLGWADSTRRQLDAAGPCHLISNDAPTFRKTSKPESRS